MRKESKLLFSSFFLFFVSITWSAKVLAQTAPLSASELKRLSIEELMNIEVISVSKKPERLTQVASAIQVITQEDISNSGAKTIAEALRLAANLQVAQVNSSQWAISSRGFNNVLANKLLVMIDGRSVYTPMYAGVFWDVQNYLLEDIERIEVISGPGGTLWGANAVNGVINIITKNVKDTQGLLVEAAMGSSLPGSGSLRYGGKLAENLSYRIYGTGYKMGHTIDSMGLDSNDQWALLQGGIKLDWKASDKDNLSFQQNTYSGDPNPDASDEAILARGSNVAVEWNHSVSQKADFQLLVYYDHTFRDFKNGFTKDLKTYNIDWNNRYQGGKRHALSYGLELRLQDYKVTNLELFKFLPEDKWLNLFSVFLQDEIMLIPNQLSITLGTKIEHNNYTGIEYQPNGRVTLTEEKQTVWAAVSRAVRTPARIDRDFFLNLTPDLLLISGNDAFISEDLIAYELGWRLQPQESISISLATFYNLYDNLRSAEPGPPPNFIPLTFGNGVHGKSYGIELSATQQLNSWWRLRGGYTFLKKELEVKPTSQDQNGATAESNDPRNQFLIQSTMDLPGRIEVGTFLRYIDKLPEPYVPDYFEMDIKLGWEFTKGLELSLVGQNLLNKHHYEFIPSSPFPRQIERSIYGKITWRY